MILVLATLISHAFALEFEVSYKGFNYKQQKVIEKVVKNTEAVINSTEFRKRVLTFQYNGEYRFSQSKGLDNAGVYGKIINAGEMGNGKWKVNIVLKKARCSTVAYTYYGHHSMYFNTCNFDIRDEVDISDTFCHEAMHILWFQHDKRRTTRRPYSVPYGIGEICANLYTDLINGKEINLQRENSPGSYLREIVRLSTGVPELLRMVKEEKPYIFRDAEQGITIKRW